MLYVSYDYGWDVQNSNAQRIYKLKFDMKKVNAGSRK